MTRIDIVGTKDIAERCDIDENRVSNWNRRGKLPDPEWVIGGRPAWRWVELLKRVPEIRELVAE